MEQFDPNTFPAKLLDAVMGHKCIGKSNKVYTYDVAAAFDTETSSFYDAGEKRGVMYIWMLGIEDFIVYGRTWEDFVTCTDIITATLELDPMKRLVIYVHNLAFDFQFFAPHLEWETVFASDSHHPLYGLTKGGIEFRCSYRLSGMNLEETAKGLGIRKMVGDLDYKLIRHQGTPMTEKEIGYCEHDILCVIAFIRSEIAKNKNITRIPLTKTGYVRRYCRKCCTEGDGSKQKRFVWKNYMDMIFRLTITLDEYHQNKRGFQGGFTHSSAPRVNKVLYGMGSADEASAYPYALLSEKYPMSKGRVKIIHSLEEFDRLKTIYGILCDITITGLREKKFHEHPISESRCFDVIKPIVDNGRIVSAQQLSTTCTNIDLDIYREYYSFERITFHTCRCYKLGYLPKDLILSLIKLYEDKTTLKGVDGQEERYQLMKGMLNSAYGMMVTDIIRLEYSYEDAEWLPKIPDMNAEIEKYNTSKRRFLFYPWGVFCTAYARRNLFEAISELGDDYVYADTDSVKYLNVEKHRAYFIRHNKRCDSKLKSMCKELGIDFERTRPKTVKGVPKPLGHFEFEGYYDGGFKTLGAKRYAYKQDGEYHITVAGVGKKSGCAYILKKYGEEGFFDGFSDDLEVPPAETGKLTHTYIDEETAGTVTDYLGNTAQYHELASIHMEPVGYVLSMSGTYINYLLSLEDEYE